MSQQTTQEFAQRLVQAVEAHPLAPGNAYGSQAWLREKLKREGGIQVSANAVHKWMNGTSRPREDNIRLIAKVLGVDEVWLSLGSIPGTRSSARPKAQYIAGRTEMMQTYADWLDEVARGQ